MSHLTVVGGSASRAPFTMNAHGIAQFMLASRYGARRIVESYAFPDRDRPKITLPSPAKELVYKYYKSHRDAALLDKSIAASAHALPAESSYDKGRRLSTMRVAQHLKKFGPLHEFLDVHQRAFHSIIHGLRVRASLDFIARLKMRAGEVPVGVVCNVTMDISDHPDRLQTHAKVESEIALRILAEQIPGITIWFIDVVGEKVVRKQQKPTPSIWREIQTVCDDIMIAYQTLIARRSQQERKAT